MVEPASYDGVAPAELQQMLRLRRLFLRDSVSSTMDLAHALGREGTEAGTLVLAEEQTAGRGRLGRKWSSTRGAGVWMTLVERPRDPPGVEVLSLRVGLHAARALAPLAPGPVTVKWPNDLYVDDRKLAGILIEARWMGTSLDYTLIGLGLNVASPHTPSDVAAIPAGVPRPAVLQALVPALREAAAQDGYLSRAEQAEFRERAYGLGRRCLKPGRGTVTGISHSGELLVSDESGEVTRHRSGSLVFDTEQA